MIAIIFVAVMSLTSAISVRADEEAEGVDIMIILDQSDSVNWHDPNRESLEAIEYLLNLSLQTGNRIGFVVYNDTIVAYGGLRTIETAADIDEIMTRLRGIRASRGTDVGLALQTARRQLELDGYRTGKTAILFISDGWYEFELFNLNRNHDDVAADVEDVITRISYPIVTIQHSVQHLHQSPKNDWALQTNGESFTAMTPAEILAAVDEAYDFIVEMAAVSIQQADGANRVHEHQLVIPIPAPDDQRAEVVEVTLLGAGLIEEVIRPDDEHIRIEAVGVNYLITIRNPEAESYTIYYLARSASPLETSIQTQMTDMPQSRVTLMHVMAIGISGMIILPVLVLLITIIIRKQQAKKNAPALTGTLECYFMEVPTGTDDIPIQSWSASFLAANNKVSLDHLLKHVPLLSKMPEAAKIFASINRDNTISIINKGGVACYKSGKEVMDKQITLRHGQGLYMVFQKNTIELELRARQSGLS